MAIGAMAMDLKRVALGIHNNSEEVAKRFFKEALKRKEEIQEKDIKPYLLTFVNKLPKLFKQTDNEKIAEDALMLSTIFQNYAQHRP